MRSRKVFLSAVMLLMACVMQAADCPKGLLTHTWCSRIHFNWDCNDQNITSADDALKQVWDYLVSTGQLADETTPLKEYVDPVTSKTGTVHHYYKQGKPLSDSSLRCDVIIAMRDGRPYFVTGSLPVKDGSDQHYTPTGGNGVDSEIKVKPAPTVEGEDVKSEVSTLFFGKQTINYTKQANKVVLYDSKRKIYAFPAGESDVVPLKEAYSADTTQYVSHYDGWAHHLPLASDDISSAFAGDAYSDYTPELSAFRCSMLSNVYLRTKKMLVSVKTPEGDTLATGTFEKDENNSALFTCKLDKPIQITRYDLRVCCHMVDGGYEDLNLPLLVTGTSPSNNDDISSQVLGGNILDIKATVDTLDALKLRDFLPVYTIAKKQPYLDAYWGIQKVYDFYHDIYGYDSYDGKGTPIYLFINPCSDAFGTKTSLVNSSAVLNEPYGVMVLGMGYIYQAENNKKRCRYMPIVDLVIMSHEFTHLVQEGCPSGGLQPIFESGSLNESFADIMGVCINAYIRGIEDKPTYTVFNCLVAPDIDITPYHSVHELIDNGLAGFPGRRMDDPEHDCKEAGPSVYHGNLWEDSSSSDTDIHTNSTVQSHWFYLLSKEVGLALARDLCFTEMRYYVTNNADYIDVCHVAKAAAKYHGLDNTTAGDTSASNKLYTAVCKSWDAVGLSDDDITGIQNVERGLQNDNDIHAVKCIENGQLVIKQNGRVYTTVGARIR